MRRDIEKGKWEMKDIIISLCILIGLYILFTFAVYRFYKPSDAFLVTIDNLLTLIPIIYLNEKYPLRFFSVFEKQNNLKYFFIGMALCLLMNLFFGILASMLQIIPKQYAFFISFDLSKKILDLSNSIVISPVVEEVLFRGFFYRILRNKYDVFWAALGSTIIFVLFHGLRIETIVNIGILGLILVYVYQKTDSILLTIFTHSIYNMSWFIFIYCIFKR